MSYRQYFNAIEADKNAKILEIGPLHRPIIRKSEYLNAIYCDIRSTDEIKSLYSGNDYLDTTELSVQVDKIVDIDVVIKDSYEATFASMHKFDYIVASHVLEHVEDLIFTLQDLSTILTDNGKLVIYYPDIRYSFDHFRAEASFRDVYDVHINKRTALARMVFDFHNSVIPENDAPVLWQPGSHYELLPTNDIKKSIEMFNRSYSGEFIDDVHYWPFSDTGFVKLLYDMTRSDMLHLICKEFYPTQFNTQEFLIVLEKSTGSWSKDDALQLLRLHYDNAYNTKIAAGDLQ